MIPELLKNRIELRFGKAIRYAKDCIQLSAEIEKHCHEKISATTLKRVFGLAVSDTQPRMFTLDVLAHYAGYGKFKNVVSPSFLSQHVDEMNKKNILPKSLMKKQKVKVIYHPDKKLELEYQKDSFFKVTDAQKSHLQKGDLVEIIQLQKELPLVCEKVIRKNNNLGSYISGNEGSIVFLELSKSKKNASAK